ncbi:hypothetical protein [Marivita lacus]|nr:hypothetical protein [Marivita lacus]
MVKSVYAPVTGGLAYGFTNRTRTRPGMGTEGLRIDGTLGNLKGGEVMYLPLARLAVSHDISNG